MAQATLQNIPTLQTLPQQANCTACLTRDCPMAGAANYPVQLCNSYRQARAIAAILYKSYLTKGG
jgi:hypothetical protein